MSTPTSRRPLSGLMIGMAVGMVGAALLAGCALGDRPSFADDGDTTTGSPPIDAVLERLDRTRDAAFRAEYVITNNFGPVEARAEVIQRTDRSRVVVIGDVEFRIDGATASTCDLPSGPCQDEIDDAQVSDLQVTHQFYGRSVADRLRVDAARRIGEPEGYEAELGGQLATCVSIPVSGATEVFDGRKVYCATDTGPLAAYQGPDQVITLVALGDPDGDLDG